MTCYVTHNDPRRFGCKLKQIFDHESWARTRQSVGRIPIPRAPDLKHHLRVHILRLLYVADRNCAGNVTCVTDGRVVLLCDLVLCGGA
jgi:hypothetical protein